MYWNSGVLEFDADKKDESWGIRITPSVIQNAHFLISQDHYNYCKSYGVGRYETQDYMLNFYDRDTILKNDPNQIRIDFQPVDLLSVYRHVTASAIDKQPISPEAKCTDELAKSKMEEDIAKKQVYKNKVEPFLKLSAKALGGDPNMVKEPTQNYNSNMEQADALGMDMENTLDRAIWKEVLQRPKWESSLEIGIDHFFQLSEETELRKRFIYDFFDTNVMTSQVIENSASGLPEITYVQPYSVYTVNATRPDRRDAIGIGYNRVISVKSFLELFIKEVKDEEELTDVLMAANIQTGMSYVGIWWGQGEQPDNTCSYNEFLGMSLRLGYIEWKTQNIDHYEKVYEYGTMNTYKRPIDFNADGYSAKKEKYKEPSGTGKGMEKRFYEQIYKWYFLQDNPVKVYGFGLLPNQVRKGTFNQLSDFSIQIYVEEGQSLTERAIPYIKRFFDAYTKFQYFMLRAKPSGTGYDVDSIYKILPSIKSPDGGMLDPTAYVRFLEGQVDFLYKSARDESGNPLGGDSIPFKKIERGLDPTAWDLVKAMQLQITNIMMITGINEVRTAASNPEDGYKASVFNLQRSQETTFYLESGLYKFMGNQAACVAYYIQQIIEENSFAMEALEEAIGEYNIECIKSLNNKSPKAFSIFIGIGMSDLEKVQVSQDAQILAQNNVITLSDKYMVESARNYHQARRLLGYFQQKAQENAQKAEANKTAGLVQLEQVKHKDKMEEIDLSGKINYKTLTDVAKINKGIDLQSEVIKSNTKKELQSEKLQHNTASSLQTHLQSKDQAYLDSQLEQQNNNPQPQPPIPQFNPPPPLPQQQIPPQANAA